MTAEITSAYLETFGCLAPKNEDGDCDHEGSCDWGWSCSQCGYDLTAGPCPDHAPTAFPGLVLVDCDAEPRHWTWIHAHDGYPAPCTPCQLAAEMDAHRGCAHALHGAWRAWKFTGRVDRWGARVGLWNGFTSFTLGGGCNGCRTRFRWSPRFWVLGVRKTTAAHVLRTGHRPVETHGEDWCKRCHPDPELSAA